MASPVCMRAVLVHAAQQDGIANGEINAALAGVRSLAGVLAPLLWAMAFGFLGRFGRGRWFYNPGGTWLVSAAGRILVLRLVSVLSN